MSKKFNFGRGIKAKGYYIALILCAVAIGISGYLYYQNNNQNDPSLANPTVGIGDPDGNDVPVVAPDPTKKPIQADTPTEPGKQVLKTGMPLSGQTVMDYAMDCLSYNPTTRDWRVHNGIDIAAEAGTPVCAAADGTVYTVYEDDTMGNTVVIRHEGDYVTTYASLDADISVAPGDTVTLGQTIGKVANTALLETEVGDHLHFCVTRNDESMDPNEFLGID